MKQFIKDGKIAGDMVIIDGRQVFNPTEEILLEAGYEIKEVEIPEPTPYQPTYEERVVELIRLRYDVNAEFAILRQRDSKSDEFEEYNAYCEECKLKAKEGVI